MAHTSGFANFRWLEADRQLRFHRAPGERYGYSGEGFELAQFVLEEGLHLDVEAELQRRVFEPLGMTRTSLRWQPQFAGDFANGHTEEGYLREHQRRARVDAAGSMDTTISDWSKLLAAVARHALPSPGQHAELVRRQIDIDSPSQFPTLREWKTDAWKAIQLGYGLGWGVFEAPQGHAYFKEGHDDGTANYALCLDEQRRCVLLLSNDVRAEHVFRPIIEAVMGPVPVPWSWEGYD